MTLNLGKFVAFLRLLCEGNKEFKDRLNNQVAKNDLYLSQKNQNEQTNEIKEISFLLYLLIKSEVFFLSDVLLVIRFDEKSKNIREKFLEFDKCTLYTFENLSKRDRGHSGKMWN